VADCLGLLNKMTRTGAKVTAIISRNTLLDQDIVPMNGFTWESE